MSGHHQAPLYAPLSLAPGRSRCLLGYAVAIHALAGAALLASRLSGAWIVLLAILVGLSLTRVLVQHIRSPSGMSTVRAVWQADDRWRVEYHDGRPRPLRRWDAPLVHPRLVMLRFWQDRFRFRCLYLCPDALDAEQLRRLRVRLRRHLAAPQQRRSG